MRLVIYFNLILFYAAFLFVYLFVCVDFMQQWPDAEFNAAFVEMPIQVFFYLAIGGVCLVEGLVARFNKDGGVVRICIGSFFSFLCVVLIIVALFAEISIQVGTGEQGAIYKVLVVAACKVFFMPSILTMFVIFGVADAILFFFFYLVGRGTRMRVVMVKPSTSLCLRELMRDQKGEES